MSLLAGMFRPDVAPLPAAEPGKWAQGMVWQPWSHAASATVDQSMRLSAVFGCLRILSDAISTLPFGTFTADGPRRLRVDPPGYLTFVPPALPRTGYLAQVMLSLLTDGNAFIATPRDAQGVPVGLVPLDPRSVAVRIDGNRIVFDALGEVFSPLDIMHITGMVLPGRVRGVSPITAAREVIDAGLSAQEYGARFFANNAVPPAVIQLPDTGAGGTADGERARQVADVWHQLHGGPGNAGKVGVLVGGASLHTVAVNPDDAQWLDSKRFGVSEIARFFGVPPHLIADASNSTSWGSGLAEQNLAFGQFSLRPWIERIEEGHNRLLHTHGDRATFVKLNLDAMLRAALRDRFDAYAIGIGAGFMTPNEARALEDWPPIPGGDEAVGGGAP